MLCWRSKIFEERALLPATSVLIMIHAMLVLQKFVKWISPSSTNVVCIWPICSGHAHCDIVVALMSSFCHVDLHCREQTTLTQTTTLSPLANTVFWWVSSLPVVVFVLPTAFLKLLFAINSTRFISNDTTHALS